MKCFTTCSVFVALIVMNLAAGPQSFADEDWTAKLKERDTHFLFQVMIGVGLGGMKTTYHAKMLDENGFEYDTMSLLCSSLSREQLGLNDEQSREIRAIYQNALDEMRQHPSRKLLDVDQTKLEPIFLAAQAEIQGKLSEAQLDRLEQIKHQLGIAKVGLAKYLTSSHFGDGQNLSAKEAEEIDRLTKKMKEQHESIGKSLLKKANQRLLDHLSVDQRRRLDDVLGKEVKAQLLESLVFTRNFQLKKKPTLRKNEPIVWIRRSRVQKKLLLSEEQVKRIKSLDRQVETLPASLLTDDQSAELYRLITVNELQRRGTVAAIACSEVAKLVGLAEEESDSFYEFGKTVFAELRVDVAKECEQQLQDAVGGLSPALQGRLAGALAEIRFAEQMPGIPGVTKLR